MSSPTDPTNPLVTSLPSAQFTWDLRSTSILFKKDVSFSIKYTFISIDTVPGYLRELIFKQSSTDRFYINLQVDGQQLLIDYRDLDDLGGQPTYIEAFQDTGGNYVVAIRDIYWFTNIDITLELNVKSLTALSGLTYYLNYDTLLGVT